MKIRIINLLVLFLLISLGACDSSSEVSKDSIYKNGARTYFQAINFNSPETVSEAFIAVWRSADYITFYALLDMEVQGELVRNMYMKGKLDLFFEGDTSKLENEIFRGASSEQIEARMESYHDLNLLFDSIFMSAAKNHKLPFLIGYTAKIKHVEITDSKALVIIKTESKPEPEIILHLKQSLGTKRWKITFIELPTHSQLESQLWGKSKLINE